MDNKEIKKNFDYYRRQKGLKIEDLAAKIGGPRQKIYSYFNSASGLTISTLERLAALVDVEPWQLLAGPDSAALQPQQPEQHHHKHEPRAAILCPYCGQAVALELKVEVSTTNANANEDQANHGTNNNN